MNGTDVFLCLGANLGDPFVQISTAIDWLDAQGVSIVKRSSWYATEPEGIEDQPWFVNRVVQASTDMSPLELLERCQQAEHRAGRTRSERYGPRLLDVDILLMGTLCLATDRLTLPHPRMHQRRFVLVPLTEIAPELKAPSTGERYADILSRLDEGKKVVPLSSKEY